MTSEEIEAQGEPEIEEEVSEPVIQSGEGEEEEAFDPLKPTPTQMVRLFYSSLQDEEEIDVAPSNANLWRIKAFDLCFRENYFTASDSEFNGATLACLKAKMGLFGKISSALSLNKLSKHYVARHEIETLNLQFPFALSEAKKIEASFAAEEEEEEDE